MAKQQPCRLLFAMLFSVNTAGAAVLSIHDNKIPEILPPESGRFFVKMETAIQWFSQLRYHRQIPNVVIAIFSVPAWNRVS